MLEAVTSPMRKFLPFPSVKLWNTATPSEESDDPDDPDDKVIPVDASNPIDKPAPSTSPFFPINGHDDSAQPAANKKKNKREKNLWIADNVKISNRDDSALPEHIPSKSKKKKSSKSKSNGESTPSSNGKRKRRKSKTGDGTDTTSKKKRKTEKKEQLKSEIQSPSPPQKPKPDERSRPVINYSSGLKALKKPQFQSAERILDSSAEEEDVPSDSGLEDKKAEDKEEVEEEEEAEEEEDVEEEANHGVERSPSTKSTASASKTPGKGRYTTDEDKIMKETTQSYIKSHGLTEEQFKERVRKDISEAYPKRETNELVGILQQKLPNRDTVSIWRQLMKRYAQDTANGPWTPEDDEQLRKLVAKKGGQWTFIGSKLGRDPNLVRLHYKDVVSVGNNRKSGPWEQGEVKRLHEIVMGLLEETDWKKKDGVDVDTISKHINWTAVSQNLGTRGRLQCFVKWSKIDSWGETLLEE